MWPGRSGSQVSLLHWAYLSLVPPPLSTLTQVVTLTTYRSGQLRGYSCFLFYLMEITKKSTVLLWFWFCFKELNGVWFLTFKKPLKVSECLVNPLCFWTRLGFKIYFNYPIMGLAGKDELHWQIIIQQTEVLPVVFPIFFLHFNRRSLWSSISALLRNNIISSYDSGARNDLVIGVLTTTTRGTMDKFCTINRPWNFGFNIAKIKGGLQWSTPGEILTKSAPSSKHLLQEYSATT